LQDYGVLLAILEKACLYVNFGLKWVDILLKNLVEIRCNVTLIYLAIHMIDIKGSRGAPFDGNRILIADIQFFSGRIADLWVRDHIAHARKTLSKNKASQT
jgi:hypothetical protein